ncbi:phage tail protein [Amycolatopsis magusensis]|uniref:Phage tail-like protein n=1 Tax=Amycolatopsis magusensis TaxID=882444 RepID=A0ABS4PV00_9PSEU|nr:phage tail protein [Amycolatopsis magusensis]MBP2182735.1 phage tail-like protein [Amycolatopsis magusensis]MDI5979521.1 phage tail protein [Amycolatopsis magusensis]
MPPPQPAHGLAMRFHVQIDGLSLGNWSSCKGLDVKAKIERVYDPGDYSHRKILFADIDYPTVKLERAVDGASTPVLRKWLTEQFSPWRQPGTIPDLLEMVLGGQTATITLLDSQWAEVCSWTLRNVYPSGWAGPTLSAKESKVAIERLELEHEGFL